MDALEAEIWLRCRLEDTLLDGRIDGGRFAAVVQAARAIGVVDDATAAAVLRDATVAERARGRHEFRDDDEDDRPTSALRVVVRPITIEADWGSASITHIVFGEHETTFGVTGSIDPGYVPTRAAKHRHGDPWQQLEVLDQSGTKHEGYLSGGSSDTGFDGEYAVHGLPPDTAALTIDGQLIEFRDAAVAPAVRVRDIDDLPAAERAARYLEILVADRLRDHGDFDRLATARETLASLGIDLPDPDEQPVVPARHVRHGRRGHRSRSDGPPRLIGIGAAPPQLDGIDLTVATLSDDGGLRVIGSASGPFRSHGTRPMLRVSARDDVGTRYDADVAQGSWGGTEFSATHRLTPALASDARVLTVVIDTLTHVAEVDVPLDWPAS